MSETGPSIRQRLDKWLWHARMARTRTLAARLVSDGHVRIDSRRVTDPARKVRAGDVLTVALAHATLVIAVEGFADRRGPATEARRLYKLLSAPAGFETGSPDDPELPDIAGSSTGTAPVHRAEEGEGDDALAPEDDCR